MGCVGGSHISITSVIPGVAVRFLALEGAAKDNHCSYTVIGFCYIFVTEFWKITHMGMPEIIKIFMFSELLLQAAHRFKNIF